MAQMVIGRRGARRRRRTVRRVTALLLAAAAAVGIWVWQRSRPVDREKLAAQINADGGDVLDTELEGVTVDLLPVNSYSRPGLSLDEVNGVVVHYTGNPGTTAEQTRSYFGNLAETGETYASSHFVIGMDGTIIQCVPLSEEAYCSNQRNEDTISIECCHSDESGQFTDETVQSLVRLMRYLVHTYGLSSDEMIRHYDVTGKLCPKYYVEHEDAWLSLKDDVFD